MSGQGLEKNAQETDLRWAFFEDLILEHVEGRALPGVGGQAGCFGGGEGYR